MEHAYWVDMKTRRDDFALGPGYHRVLKYLLKLLYK